MVAVQLHRCGISVHEYFAVVLSIPVVIPSHSQTPGPASNGLLQKQ